MTANPLTLGAEAPEATNMSLPEANRILGDFGLAAFAWNAASDAFAWSSAAAALLQISEAALPKTGRSYLNLLDPDTAPARAAAVPAFGSTDATTYTIRYRLRTDHPNERWIEETGRWLHDGTGTFSGTEGFLRTVDLAGSADRPQPGASPIRREGLLTELDACIEALKRDRQGSVAFLVIAVDGLSRINANFGYEIGDRIIETVAERISRRMRHGDVLGRLSGHKFGAILRNCSELMIQVAADRFRRAVTDELIATEEAQIEARVSIGAVVAPRNAVDADSAAVRAEEALAEARAPKAEGFAIYHPSPTRDRARRDNLAVAEEIRRGLAEDRFVLAYQPIVSARTGAVLAYEALSRLIGTDHRVMSAASVIATAERLGLVRRIDRRTLTLALADLSENPGLRLSVNASVDSATDPQWLGAIMDAVSADRSVASRLTVEITETSAMLDVDTMRRVSETLRDVGCKVAIDDFGAGYTSFQALRDLELDRIKIDGTYIADVVENPDSVAFVKALTALAGHFGITTVAEWVQDEAAALVLRDLGLDALQGHWPGEPKLRVTRETAAVLAEVRLSGETNAGSYRDAAGILEGPISCAEE